MFWTSSFFDGHHGALVAFAIAPAGVLFARPARARAAARRPALALAPRRGDRCAGCAVAAFQVRAGLRVFRSPARGLAGDAGQLARLGRPAARPATCCCVALGLDDSAGFGAAAAVLFAVNVTAAIPATPSNLGVFQAACVAVLSGAYGVSHADALGLRDHPAGRRDRDRRRHGRPGAAQGGAAAGATCGCGRCTPRRSSSSRAPTTPARVGPRPRARCAGRPRRGPSRRPPPASWPACSSTGATCSAPGPTAGGATGPAAVARLAGALDAYAVAGDHDAHRRLRRRPGPRCRRCGAPTCASRRGAGATPPTTTWRRSSPPTPTRPAWSS